MRQSYSAILVTALSTLTAALLATLPPGFLLLLTRLLLSPALLTTLTATLLTTLLYQLMWTSDLMPHPREASFARDIRIIDIRNTGSHVLSVPMTFTAE